LSSQVNLKFFYYKIISVHRQIYYFDVSFFAMSCVPKRLVRRSFLITIASWPP